MIKPNLNSLNTQLSSSTKASDSDLAWREFLVAISHFTNDCSYRIMEEEVADITKSLYNWTTRRDYEEYKRYDIASRSMKIGTVKVGDIFLADLGINYKPECAYLHPVLVIGVESGIVLTVPTSTNADKYSSGFHPDSNPQGKWIYRRVQVIDGFAENCVLMLNNVKTISKGRLIEHKGTINTLSIIDEVKLTIIENFFSKQYHEFVKMREELKQKDEIIAELNSKLENISNIA